MKRTLAMILALVLSLSLLAGCGSTKSDDAAADGQSGSRPSIVRFSADSTPKIDPAVINDLVGSICVENLYDGLVLQDGSEQVPNLATDWTVSEDGLSYTFHLKQGVKFHSGNEMKASDVVFSFDRFKTIGEGFAYLFANVATCTADDDYTVTFTLSQSMGSFMGIIWHLYVLDEATVMANIAADGTYGDKGDYCKDCQGHGPAWEHSLFEDNAEFAYGFFHAQDAIRKELLLRLDAIKSAGIAAEAVEAYQNGWNKHESSRAVTDALLAALEKAQQTEDVKYILENRAYLAKKSIWAVGGDGWAYDIGFGGIDHVMAQNRDVNLLVLDTEVYSNTGGQASKATPTSATAKFAAGGKQVAKKDLGGILMQYGYVYVAQVAMGADQAQTLRALREAESYDGPSIVICYCPCLEQHIKAGMGNSQLEMKKAVECGYWHLYRYDPRRIAEGKNPFQLDSPEPDTDKLMDFLMGENRFASLKNNFPEKADALYAKEIADVKARYAKYKKMAQD